MRPAHLFSAAVLLVLAAAPAAAEDFPAPGGAPPAPGSLPPPASRRLSGPTPPGSVHLPPSSGPASTAPAGGTAGTPVRREVSGTGIVETRVDENVALTGGGSAVQVTLRFRVVRDDGRHFYVNALFFDRATGQAMQARRAAFADPGTGALYVISQPAVHQGGDREYEVTLQVPHDAFPAAPAGGASTVEARVSLFRRSLAGGMDESMDWTTAAFALRGPAAAPVVPATPTASTAPTASPSSAFPAPSTEPVPAPASPTFAPASTPAAAPGDPAAATRIVSVAKQHNQQVSDGRLELWLPVRYRVVGDAGRSFYVQAVFFDRGTGQPISSVRSTFADRTTGALYVLTQPVVHGSGSGEYEATLRVPYDAFPRPAGAATAVEARITLFRRDLGAGMDASMDVQTVSFNVHGS